MINNYNNRLFLLDTMVAAGILFGEDNKSRAWLKVVAQMMKDYKSSMIAIPTPVFYELAQYNEKLYKIIYFLKLKKNIPKILKYINYSITPNILIASSNFKLHCCSQNKKTNISPNLIKQKQKISFIDSVLAAYCLVYNYLIITENQKDYPEKFFRILNIKLSPACSKQGERRFIYLLEPKKNEWDKSFIN